MIGRNGERGSRISALAARHDDDDDEYLPWIGHVIFVLQTNIYQNIAKI